MTVAYAYTAMPVLLAVVAATVTSGQSREGAGMFPGPVLWFMALAGLVVSWNIVRRTTQRPTAPKPVFQAFLVSFVAAEFPVLVAFMSVLLGGPLKDYIGVAAMATVYFVVVALPAARRLSQS